MLLRNLGNILTEIGFQKSPFSSRRKRSKVFSFTLAFSYYFYLSTLKTKRLQANEGLLFKSLHFQPFSKVSVFINVFDRLSVDDR